MKILIASHNPGKIDRFKNLLKDLKDFEVVSLEDEGITIDVHEPFLTSKENAVHKAKEYANLSGLITLAIDDSATTNFLPDNEQPGVFLKRYSKDRKELSEKGIHEVWRDIFQKYPQEDKRFIWNSTIAYCNPKNGSTGDILIEKIDHVVQFSDIIAPGYPMGSFLSPKVNGTPYSELSEEEKYIRDEHLFDPFVEDFRAWLNK